MIPLLPRWVLTNSYPAFYDSESKSSIEQTARLYAKMQELIKDYNSFVDEINKNIEEFFHSTKEDQECFMNKMTKLIHDYIHSIDEKIKLQDSEINKAINYMKTNLKATITELISEMKTSGELDQAILEAFDNIASTIESLESDLALLKPKVETLETNVNTINSNLTDITNRTVALEKIEYVLKYNETSEDLSLEKIVKESE